MVRTQIQLTEEQSARLKEIAHAGNKSMAALIRKALDQFLAKQEPDRQALYRRAAKVIGKYRSGVPDISLEHDRYLEEDFK
ncbi:MAG: ribbon-helix-helix protein, CopG family [Syntrophobacteraceae bacterium]